MRRNITLRLEGALWENFKLHCVQSGINYSDMVEELVMNYLTKEEKPRKRQQLAQERKGKNDRRAVMEARALRELIEKHSPHLLEGIKL